jgi:hypothetical protein
MAIKKSEGYIDLINQGQKLISDVMAISDNPKRSFKTCMYANIVVKYHKWKKSIWQFLELNPRNKISASFFKEPDGVPTLDDLEKYGQISDMDFDPALVSKIVVEIKRKNERIREIEKVDEEKPKIELVFLGVRGLCLKSDKTKNYVPKDNTARYGYLEIIIDNKGKPIEAKRLIKKLGGKWNVNSKVIVSQEISAINKMIKQKLGLKNNLILGEIGYRLNIAEYEIISG